MDKKSNRHGADSVAIDMRQDAGAGGEDATRIGLGSLFLSFLKIGVIGFGGGSALIPIVERELVDRRRALSADKYLKHTIVANITPGALPVKLGATCGCELGGIPGALACAYAVSLPGVLLTIVMLALFSLMGRQTVQYFHYASVGITVFIVFLLAEYILKTVRIGAWKTNLALCLAAFLLTGGKELREIAGELWGPELISARAFFDISTIQLMLLSFFMILLLQKSKSNAEMLGGFAACGAYAFCCGKTGAALGLSGIGNWMLLVMFICLGLLFFWRRQKAGARERGTIPAKALIVAGMFVGVPVLLVAVGLLAGYHNLAEFILKVVLSTITSFGGGEAYLSVADGIFVQGGYLAPDLFYTRLVPAANALPGPILVKIASGIGFLRGGESGVATACLFAFATMCAAIGACSAVVVLVMSIYESIRHSAFVISLKQYILPVICGMLLSTSCAMLAEALHITGEKAIPSLLSLAVMLPGVFLLHVLHKKFHLHDLVLLVGSAALSLGALTVIG